MSTQAAPSSPSIETSQFFTLDSSTQTYVSRSRKSVHSTSRDNIAHPYARLSVPSAEKYLQDDKLGKTISAPDEQVMLYKKHSRITIAFLEAHIEHLHAQVHSLSQPRVLASICSIAITIRRSTNQVGRMQFDFLQARLRLYELQITNARLEQALKDQPFSAIVKE
ncbi:hypothetical protein F5877DRAFT_72962 [Lentinula edodes]|nr:hypothetical protein F5877DRAFT_72962 [Lentinula edodes]